MLVSWCFEPSQPQRITSGLRGDKTTHNLCGWASDVLSKINSAKRYMLGSKMAVKVRDPKQEECLNCMKPCNVRLLFQYD